MVRSPFLNLGGPWRAMEEDRGAVRVVLNFVSGDSGRLIEALE